MRCLLLRPYYQVTVATLPQDAAHAGTAVAVASAAAATIADAEVVWQVPAADTRLRGVMFIAHGCGCVPGCRRVGVWGRGAATGSLPEEMNVTLHLLLRGYAAVAVSSADRTRSRPTQLGSVWFGLKSTTPTPPPAAPAAATTTYTASGGGAAQPPVQPSSRPLPRYALGGSSGGGFVMGLPLVFPPGYWSGLVVQIAAAPSGLLTAHL
eukprot:XP_001703691.1 predicted protein [Chlamydomonas reinhardtii]